MAAREGKEASDRAAKCASPTSATPPIRTGDVSAPILTTTGKARREGPTAQSEPGAGTRGSAAQAVEPREDPPATRREPWSHLSQGFLRRHADGAEYDDELAVLLRVAARAGVAQGAQNAVNFTTLLIGFMFCDDAASRFLQGHPHVRREELLASRNLRIEDNNELRFVYQALKESLPPEQERLYSSSAVQMLDLASDITHGLSGTTRSAIGTRHLLAAYLFHTPGNHTEELRRWGLNEPDLAASFSRLVEKNWPSEAAGWRSLYGSLDAQAGRSIDVDLADKVAVEDAVNASAQHARYVGVASFGADDPSIQRRDLLDVKDEARAFARIAASRDTRLPLSVGVFGEWGSGKTFFMGLMAEHVEKLSRDAERQGEGSLFLRDIVQIKFNAWHYIEANLWASLVEYIFTELNRKLQGSKPREQIERLFEQLSTSRLLKLEAIDELIAKRRERKTAEERLGSARRDYEAALLRQSAVTSTQFWRVVFETFRENLNPQDARRVDDLARSLGLKEIARSAASLNEVLKEAETEAGRAHVLNRAMIAKLGQGRWIVSLVAALVVIPAAIVILKDAASPDWIKQINSAVLAFSGMLATVGAFIGKAVGSARSALNELESFRDKLDAAVKKRSEEFKSRSGDATTFAEAEREVARLKSELEQAERKFAEADKRSDDVLRDYRGASARGRLNAFIRDKLASGEYARHLGLIATIRKDFEQLAQLMADTSRDKESHEKYLRAHHEYLKRLREVLDQAKQDGILSAEEAHEMGKDDTAAEPGLFTRIVLYIDDLDRCPPAKVVDVLQAIHLLLYFPLFVVVVAVDARWVSRSLREQFPQLLAENIIAPWSKSVAPPRSASPDSASQGAGSPQAMPTAATSHDYLEKIFQIPYWVRPMDREASKKYVKGIAEPDVRRGAAADVAGQREGPPARATGASQDSMGAAGDSPLPNAGVSQAAALQSAAPTLSDGRPTPAEKAVAHAAADDAQDDDAAYVAQSMILTREEGEFLEALAPFVGSTPRRGLRFVNIYRLVKTSLSERLQRELQEQSNHLSYRALMAQLAIVTGAPHISWAYFHLLESSVRALGASRKGPSPRKGQRSIESLPALCDQLNSELADVDGSQKAALLGALEVLRALNQRDGFDTSAQLLETLHELAPVARRYSFTARHH